MLHRSDLIFGVQITSVFVYAPLRGHFRISKIKIPNRRIPPK